jgi:hypothetical protein
VHKQHHFNGWASGGGARGKGRNSTRIMDQWRQISSKGLPFRTRALLILLVRSMQAHDFTDGKKEKRPFHTASFRTTRPWTHRKQLGGPGEVGDRVPSSGVGPVLDSTRSRLRVAGTEPARRCRDESEGPHGDVVRCCGRGVTLLCFGDVCDVALKKKGGVSKFG